MTDLTTPQPPPTDPESSGARASKDKPDTKDALLDAAEVLFAELGIERTSLRAVTSLARANIASVNYHFGSKEGLVRAVLERRLRPLNEQRLRLLEAYEAESRAGLEQILRAFVAPPLEFMALGNPAFTGVMARLHFSHDQELQSILFEVFEPVVDRFAAALGRALPELDEGELFHRLHFAVGAMAGAVIHQGRLLTSWQGRIPDHDQEEATNRLITFLAAGFRA